MKQRAIISAIVIGLSLLMSCGSGQLLKLSLPEIKIKAGMDGDTIKTVEGINQTILDINTTLKAGIDIGAETRDVIDNLTKEIKQFNQSGIMGKEGVAVIRQLVTVVDRGIKVDFTLDESTVSMVNDLAGVIDKQPEKWGEQSELLIKVLGLVGTELADKIAGDVSKLSEQLTTDISELGQVAGQEARCTIDFTGQTINYTIEQAGGKFVAGLLPFLEKLYAEGQEPAQIPSICTIAPSQIQLVWREGKLVADNHSRLITISGFNFSNQLPPTVTLQSEEGTIYPDIPLKAIRETSYQVTVNLDGKTFTAVKPGAKLVFVWSAVIPDATFEKAVLIESAPVAIANFKASTTRGDAPLTVQFFDDSSGEPTSRFWEFGDGVTSREKNPTHEYKQLGTFSVKLTVSNQFSQPNIREERDFVVVTAPPIEARFDGAPRSGVGSLVVTFQDRSIGNPVSWLWDFGDGTSSNSREPLPHTYGNVGSYTVRLTVSNAFGTQSVHEEPAYIVVQEPTPQQTFTISQSPVVEANKYGLCGDMSADYNLLIPIPSGFRWDENVDKVRELTQVWGRPIGHEGGDMNWNIEGTPWLQDNDLVVRVHVGAGCWVGGPKIFMQAKAQFISTP